MARMVATKASLSIRVDALSDAESRSDPQAAEIGITNRVKLESRLRALEHQAGIQSTRRTTAGAGRQQPKFEMTSGAGSYNNATDSVKLPTQPVAKAVEAVLEVKEEKREERREEEKDRKKKRKSEGNVEDAEGEEPVAGETKEERRARKAAKKAVS
jgi:nucleolar protein 58